MTTTDWMLNLTVFGVLMEADLGRRKIGTFRVVRPLLTAAAVVALFLGNVPTGGNNLALQALGVALGILVGLASHLFLSVRLANKAGVERPVSRAGVGYAVFWSVIFAARLLFIYGSEHWFGASLIQFLSAHQLSAAGLTDALIFMALAMALARSALLAGRAVTTRRSAYQLQEA